MDQVILGDFLDDRVFVVPGQFGPEIAGRRGIGFDLFIGLSARGGFALGGDHNRL